MRGLPLLAALCSVSAVCGFDLVREYAEDTFFDRWSFYGFWDNLTSGDVEYLNRTDAFSSKLVSISPQGNAIIRVDNATNVPWNYKRNSIRIESDDLYDFGTLWVFDINHLPYGCSVWPSIWTHGEDWPIGGEIDIIEAVNFMKVNQMTLHTLDGCMRADKSGSWGDVGGKNCSTPAGCTIKDKNPSSYGAPFAQAGGGVWATQFDIAGVYIWFWSRANVPDSLKSGDHSKVDISKWGAPFASYPSTNCDMAKYFTKQKIILNISLCGNWAGLPAVYNTTCSTGKNPLGNPNVPANSLQRCYLENVVGPGSPRYDNAYFDINAIRAYTTAVPSPTTSSTSGGPHPTTAGGGALSHANASSVTPSVLWPALIALVATWLGAMNVPR
ncbi:glycoside hydrolase family 16 protein [Auriculariales sp. MPI-PUGE-AT-0066]|nr:glycoside hydrolase family 16 protein [Auriculariales sp. MPI-PUGE-AT-0066]